MYLQASLDILAVLKTKAHVVVFLVGIALAFSIFALLATGVGYRAHGFAHVGKAAAAGCVAVSAREAEKESACFTGIRGGELSTYSFAASAILNSGSRSGSGMGEKGAVRHRTGGRGSDLEGKPGFGFVR